MDPLEAPLNHCRVCGGTIDSEAAVCDDCLANGHGRHGTRQTYQGERCRCDACRAANTHYSADYRSGIRDGRPPLGAHVAGTDVDRCVSLLVTEGFTKAQIARALGHQTPHLQYRATVTLRSQFRVQRLVREWTS